jgi:hypothetical protein
LQHFEIAVGIAEGGDWTAADVLVDAIGFPVLSSMKLISGSRKSVGAPSFISNRVLIDDPTTCSGGIP